MALQLKKFKEQQMQQADAQLIQVLSLLDAVEWEEQQLKVFEGLKAGNSVLDSIHKVRLWVACKQKNLREADALGSCRK